MRRRLLRGAASNYVGRLSAAATSLLLTPFLLHTLGPDAYGLWVLVGSFFAYGALLDLGIGGAVVKYVSEHAARGEAGRASAVVATAMRLYLVLGLIAAAAGVALAPYVPRLVDLPPAGRAAVVPLVVLTGVNVGATIALTPTAVALQGLQRYDLYNLVGIAGTLLAAAATVVVVLAGGGVVGMAWVALAVTAATRWAYFGMIRRAAPELRFGWTRASRAVGRRILSFSAASFLTQLGGRLSTRTDEVVIATLLPLGAIAPYAVARKLAEAAQLLADQFLKMLMPLASELDAVGDRERLRSLYVVGTRLTLAIVVPSAVLLVHYAAPILSAWVGPSYAGAAELVVLLALAGLVDSSQWAAAAVLQGMARQRLLAAASVGAGLANVVLSIVLARVLGLAGVAWGTLIPATVASLGVILPYAMRTLEIAPAAAAREIWLPGLLPALPMAAALAVLDRLLAPESFAAVVAAALCGGAVYAVAYLAMPAVGPERELARRAAARVVRFAPRTGDRGVT